MHSHFMHLQNNDPLHLSPRPMLTLRCSTRSLSSTTSAQSVSCWGGGGGVGLALLLCRPEQKPNGREVGAPGCSLLAAKALPRPRPAAPVPSTALAHTALGTCTRRPPGHPHALDHDHGLHPRPDPAHPLEAAPHLLRCGHSPADAAPLPRLRAPGVTALLTSCTSRSITPSSGVLGTPAPASSHLPPCKPAPRTHHPLYPLQLPLALWRRHLHLLLQPRQRPHQQAH